ncbi:WD domain, G-beta repeat-containing protein [Entamoeba nuttalli P19]|uniref:WD domain, G-beta repeat-containing protein n=1 Tax=Entamoeba nuttalli (strain P19) TaxID=1076696 RepID=K2H2P9_ENTNP|nr:WD domain, G-beta repeat-containing protein [Entamoeba nuttalli P19]EKE41793.1 WD domain, G-beta repeat-containing protein [Entamoeba nuttalli P19]|eukprot:XP_008855869.1 WD domain, G-beta repeat-containing protein [Entamoeba nuttalli P19]
MTENFVTQSNLLRCFRTLGLFAGNQPAACCSVGKLLHLMVPVEHSFISYDITHKLDFLYRSQEFKERVMAVYMRNYQAIVVTKHSVYFEGEVQTFNEVSIEGTISSSLLFGDHLIISTESRLVIITIDTHEIYKKIPLPCESPTIFHPREYLNKITLTCENQLYLMNINTEKLLFTFKFPEKIVGIAQSPDVDIHAIALESGEIQIFNLKQNKKICSLINSHQPTALNFISGLPDDDLFLVVGCVNGFINIFSIKTGVIVGSLFHHTARVHTLITFPNELHFYSVGDDNAIRQYVIDPNSGSLIPALIRERCGHPMKPIYVKITGNNVITGSVDGSIRSSSLFNPMLTKEFSQKVSIKAKRMGVEQSTLKLNQVNCIDVNERYYLLRDTVVTTHNGKNLAVTWDIVKMRIGDNKMRSSIVDKRNPNKKFQHSSAPELEVQFNEICHTTYCCFSHCGNFVCIGNSQGLIDKFNVQSGEHKCIFNCHKMEITGLAVDSNNKYLISSSMDGKVLLWDFETGELIDTIVNILSGITHFSFNKKNNLCAVTTASNELMILDLTTRKIIRQTDMRGIASNIKLNTNGNFVFVSYTNGCLTVYDIITMKIVDVVRFSSAVISMDISADGRFFVCYLSKSFELQVYYLRDYFSNILLDAPSKPYYIKFYKSELSDSTNIKNYCYDDINVKMETETQEIRETTILLEATDNPIAKWINLPELDRLRKEMQIEQTRLNPVEIPFFIPINQHSDAIFKPLKADSKLLSNQPSLMESTLILHLTESNEAILTYLMSLNSSRIDLEIRNLSNNDYQHLNTFLKFLNDELNTSRNYDFIITITQVTLRTHIREMMKHLSKYYNELTNLKETIEKMWGPVDELFNEDFSLVAFLSGIKI